MSRPPLSWVAAIYINIFRGVPALVSVIWVYFGVSLIVGINFTVFQAGVIALVLLYGAFIAEIYRAALEAIPRGQREAGLALGMHPLRVFARVILPQATKIAIPNIGSMFIGMVKDTSTFTVIGLLEVVRVTQNLNSTTFQPFVLYTAAAGRVRDRGVCPRLHLPGDREVARDAADRAHLADAFAQEEATARGGDVEARSAFGTDLSTGGQPNQREARREETRKVARSHSDRGRDRGAGRDRGGRVRGHEGGVIRTT